MMTAHMMAIKGVAVSINLFFMILISQNPTEHYQYWIYLCILYLVEYIDFGALERS